MSSWIWNAKPMARANPVRAASCWGVAFPVATAPITTLASINAPVLWACINFSCSKVRDWPVAAKSIAWPAAIPEQPLWIASSLSNSTIMSAETCFSEDSVSKLRAWRASPAKIAVASSNWIWQVGAPRLKLSLSMAGKSSWIRE